MSENPTPEGTQPEGTEEQPPTFTQADVDRIVRERVQRERAKYADYDELKVKAGEKATLEERVAEIEQRAIKAEAEALRSRIAGEYGISTKRGPKSDAHPDGAPSDAELFLTGSDETTMRAAAERLAARESERKQNNNVVPTEGNNPQPGNDAEREFARNLFARATAD